MNPAAPLAALALAFSWSASSCVKPESSPADEARKVRAVVVEASLIPDEVSGFGSLAYRTKVDAAAPEESVIAALPYREGDRVQAGAIVARLRNPHLDLAVGRAMNDVSRSEAAVALADARLFEGRLAVESRLLGIERDGLELELARGELAEAERKQADQEQLFKAGGVPEESIRSGRFSVAQGRDRVALLEKGIAIGLIGLRDEDLKARGFAIPGETEDRMRALAILATESLAAERAAAIAGLDAARKELESARIAVGELTLRTPIGGVVGARYFEAGERVKRDDKLLSIIDVASLYAVAQIQETEAVRLAVGMKAEVRVDSAGESIEGRVELVSPIADARSASFSVRVAIDDPGGKLKPGMFARIVVAAGPPSRVLVVPDGAIVGRSGDSGRVFVVIGGMARERQVIFGEMAKEGRAVLSGLAEGDVVVDAPDPGVREGDRVSVSN